MSESDPGGPDAEPAADGGPPWWLWPNVLSLDAPLVAGVWLWLLAACDRLSFGWPTYFALTGVVWCIYTADRLVDVWRTPRPAAGAEPWRKRFARQWWRPMLALLVVVAAATVWVILTRVPVVMLSYGITVAALVWLYLAYSAGRRSAPAGAALLVLAAVSYLAGLTMRGVLPVEFALVAAALAVFFSAVIANNGVFDRPMPIPRELLCGLVFAAGVSLPVQVYNASGLGSLFSGPVAFFAVLCGLNCLVIAVAEWREDRGAEPSALPQRVPAVRNWVPGLCCGLAAAALWLAFSGGGESRPVGLAVAAGAVGLLLVDRFAKRLGSAVPLAADLALVVPVPLLVP